MNTVDLLKIDRYIEDTKSSGEEIDSMLEGPLKTLLLDDVMTSMCSKDINIRATAHSISKKFLSCDEAHKRRVLERMSRSNM